MSLSTRSLPLLLAAAVFANAAGAQEPVRQSLKDAWVAASQELLTVDYDVAPSALVLKNAGDEPRSFKALAFESPTLGTPGVAARGLIAVDGTKISVLRERQHRPPA